jgi:hypothetical protein
MKGHWETWMRKSALGPQRRHRGACRVIVVGLGVEAHGHGEGWRRAAAWRCRWRGPGSSTERSVKYYGTHRPFFSTRLYNISYNLIM